MKVKVKKLIICNFGVKVSANKFYEAEERDGYYSLKLSENHSVLVSKKNIKECKE